jgi:hypothetical protein
MEDVPLLDVSRNRPPQELSLLRNPILLDVALPILGLSQHLRVNLIGLLVRYNCGKNVFRLSRDCFVTRPNGLFLFIPIERAVLALDGLIFFYKKFKRDILLNLDF